MAFSEEQLGMSPGFSEEKLARVELGEFQVKITTNRYAKADPNVDYGGDCLHESQHDDSIGDYWVCERSRGHDGYHMLQPDAYPSAFEVWDDDGTPITELQMRSGIPAWTKEYSLEIWNRVEEGALYLQRMFGHRWHDRIDLDELDELEPETSVLGLMYYGIYDDGVIALDAAGLYAHNLAFDDDNGDHRLIELAWRDKINELRGR